MNAASVCSINFKRDFLSKIKQSMINMVFFISKNQPLQELVVEKATDIGFELCAYEFYRTNRTICI